MLFYFSSPTGNFVFIFLRWSFRIRTVFSFSIFFVFGLSIELPFCALKVRYTVSFLHCRVLNPLAASIVWVSHHILVPWWIQSIYPTNFSPICLGWIWGSSPSHPEHSETGKSSFWMHWKPQSVADHDLIYCSHIAALTDYSFDFQGLPLLLRELTSLVILSN